MLWKKVAALALVLPTALAFVLGFRAIRADAFVIGVVTYCLFALLLAEANLLWKNQRGQLQVLMVVILVAAILVVLHLPQFSESEHDRMVRQVKQSLIEQGIQAGAEPVVELNEKVGSVWTGTATYGEIIYDLRISKDPLLGWRIARQRRLPQPKFP